jgi:hypothetical protein
MEAKPNLYQTLDTLSESLRASRRSAYLLQLSQQEQEQPQQLSTPQLLAELV